MHTIMFSMSLPHQSLTIMIQNIFQYQIMINRNYHTLWIPSQTQEQFHTQPTTPLTQTAATYIPLYGCPITTILNYHRQSTSNSEAQGSSLALAGMNHRTTLHQHIPTKRGRSLVSAVLRQFPTLRTQIGHHKPSTKTPS